LKYIGGIHSYLKPIIIIFNKYNLDGVCVQSTHFESSIKNDKDNLSKNSIYLIVGKHQEKGKMEWTTTMKKEDDKHSCSHYKKGHDDAKCWKLHPELRPNRFGNKKGNKKTTTTIK
jgi:hypothetical protein